MDNDWHCPIVVHFRVFPARTFMQQMMLRCGGAVKVVNPTRRRAAGSPLNRDSPVADKYYC